MITQYVFMTEEASMEEFLKVYIEKSFPEGIFYIIIPHEGKQDLEKSIPRKLKAWSDNDEVKYRFIIIRDKDSGDCIEIKQKLLQLSIAAGREDSVVIIAVHELESWFLGDLRAVGLAYNQLDLYRKQSNAKFRNPDLIANASDELYKTSKHSAKISRARKISPFMNYTRNASESFNYFVMKMKEIISV